MREGSVENESDADGNVIATSTTQCDDDADATLTSQGILTAPMEVDEGTYKPSFQDVSQNDDKTAYQQSVDEEGKMQVDNQLVSGSLNSQKEKHRVSTGHTIQPGAIAMQGLNERNNDMSSVQESTILNSSEYQGEVIKATPTVAMGLDQADHLSQATSPSSIPQNKDATDRHRDEAVAHVDFPPEYPEDDTMRSAMVEAELVMPPVEAVRVSIDEDQSTGWNRVHPLELEHAPSRENLNGTRSKKFGPVFWVLFSFLIGIVICATMIPYVLQMMINGSYTVSSSPSDCYTSLLDILLAQVSDEDLDAPTYIICPDTYIKIGTMNNPATDDYRYVNGDYPIMVTRENVTIQCGWNGRRDNNCVIDAGFMHMLTLQAIAMADGTTYLVNRTNDNLLIRGVTFTGMLINVGPFRGSSVSLSHPGKNMRFEDCLWYNVTAQSGLIGVYRNYYQVLVGLPLEDLSIEVTFADCVFQNVVFDSPFIFVRNQAIKLERCIFRDIQLSVLVEDYCRYYSGESGEVVETNQGCATLLHCASQSYCSMKDVCVHDIEINGQGIVVIYENTTFKHEGLYLQPNSTKATCEMAILSNLDGTNFTCHNIFDEPSCPILS